MLSFNHKMYYRNIISPYRNGFFQKAYRVSVQNIYNSARQSDVNSSALAQNQTKLCKLTQDVDIKTNMKLKDPLYFIFKDETLLLHKELHEINIPSLSHISVLNFASEQALYLGQHNHQDCFLLNFPQIATADLLPLALHFYPLREAHSLLGDKSVFQMAIKAMQISYWNKKTQFCGTCGTKTSLSPLELAKCCGNCHELIFTQISPAMLALVWRDDEILLARSSSFKPGIYSILAGFVETGETLEQTVAREVVEEVGIQIKNLRYIHSQPWPFPSNLMLGFTAEYASGNIEINKKELEDAQWFSIHNLPSLPSTLSLSRQMIDAHVRSRNHPSTGVLPSLPNKKPLPQTTTSATATMAGSFITGFWKPLRHYVQKLIEEMNRPVNK